MRAKIASKVSWIALCAIRGVGSQMSIRQSASARMLGYARIVVLCVIPLVYYIPYSTPSRVDYYSTAYT